MQFVIRNNISIYSKNYVNAYIFYLFFWNNVHFIYIFIWNIYVQLI